MFSIKISWVCGELSSLKYPRTQPLSRPAGDFQAGFDVVGAAILVFEVEGVFPDVDSVDQGGGFHQW